MKKVKYTTQRNYRDFIDYEIQEKIVEGIKKTKAKSFFKKIVGKIFNKIN